MNWTAGHQLWPFAECIMCLLGRMNSHTFCDHGDLLIEVCVGGIRAKKKHLPFSEITDNWKFHILASRSYLFLKKKTDKFQPSNLNQYSTLTQKSKQWFLFYFPKYFAIQLKAKFKIIECILSFPIPYYLFYFWIISLIHSFSYFYLSYPSWNILLLSEELTQ